MAKVPLGMDPQLDANVLIRLLNEVPEFVTYAQKNQQLGLTYNRVTREEFLAQGSAEQLQLLEERYGIRLSQEKMPLLEMGIAARLQAAFHGDPLRRSLQPADAGVAATAFIKKDRLATGDLQFYKRARDLGIDAEYVGAGRAAARAAAYTPRPVIIP